MSSCAAFTKKLSIRQKELSREDAVFAAAESGESKRYSEWAVHARAISEQMWQIFQASGEDADGDLAKAKSSILLSASESG